ncbi:hypothetical protein AVEN_106156-1, partial [Araneus ventricosus]
LSPAVEPQTKHRNEGELSKPFCFPAKFQNWSLLVKRGKVAVQAAGELTGVNSWLLCEVIPLCPNKVSST